MLYYFNSQQISNIAENSYRTEGSGANTPTAKTSEYSYDANGNLIYTASGKIIGDKLQATNTRKLLWEEENRLLGVSDNGFVSQYWYDAAGERTVKESFDNEGVYVNGALSGARTGTTKYTAYISPYLVLNNGGNYTKHIYVGSQRIVSKWGNSSIFDAERPTDADAAMINDFSKKYTLQTNNIKTRFDSLGVSFKGKVYSGMNVNPESDALGQGTNALPFKYFYHPDHLGSSSLITDGNGYLVQNIQYVPFGEVFVEERNATWSTPYKFNGKEQDEETGLCYYGARYYDPRTSVWLSVDPLAEKYPNISSYVYCYNNPLNYIDPDGRAGKKTGFPRPGYVDYRASSDMRYVGFFYRHPGAAISIGQFIPGSNNLSTVAVRFSTRGNILYGSIKTQKDEGSENGAFRHTLWQAGITAKMGKKIALEAGNAHEENPSANLFQRNFNSIEQADPIIDLLNNQIGRSIGEQNANASMDELAMLVLDEFAKNGLWTATQGENGKWIVNKTVLSQDKYNQLKNIFKEIDEQGRKPEENKTQNNSQTDKPYIGGRQPNL